MKKETRIGVRIRNLRLKEKLSQEDAAAEAGIPVQMLADIEDMKIAPPLGVIVSLARAFKSSVGDIFGESGDSPFCIVRSSNRDAVSRFGHAGGASGGYSYASLGLQKQNRQMEPFMVTLTPAPEGVAAQPNQHGGEEFIFVLDGKVDVRLAGHTDLLEPGDSIYYDSSLPHEVTCHGDRPATILAVIYAAKEMMIF